MNILPEIRLPGPAILGQISLPALEAPPLQLPAKPSTNGGKAIQHGIGSDIADFSDVILSAIPGVNVAGAVLDPIKESIQDLHASEIYDLLDKEEYKCYLKYNKVFPSTVAAVRCTCFKGVKIENTSEGIRGLIPMSPAIGPPLPSGFGITWKGVK